MGMKGLVGGVGIGMVGVDVILSMEKCKPNKWGDSYLVPTCRVAVELRRPHLRAARGELMYIRVRKRQEPLAG